MKHKVSHNIFDLHKLDGKLFLNLEGKSRGYLHDREGPDRHTLKSPA